MYSNKENISILCDLMLQHGIRHVVVCPGSRNAPLVHNFDVHPDFICHAATDERSAGFLALGLTLATGSPAAVCVTSGSALLNVLPAVAEAAYQRQGFLVISADRPAAWIDQLDGQTLPQQGALGGFAPMSVSIPEPTNAEQHWHCNRLVNEALLALRDKGCRPVHINVPLTEPLFDFSLTGLPRERVVMSLSQAEAAARLAKAQRPMVVMGQLPSGTRLPDGLTERITVLAEPLSVAEPSVSDQVIAALPPDAGAYQPDCVLYLGGHTISKRLRLFLRALPEEAEVIMVNAEGRLQDVTQHTRYVVKAEAEAVLREVAAADLRPSDFHRRWTDHIYNVREGLLRDTPDYSPALAVKLFEATCPQAPDMVFYANSTAVRLAAVYARHYCHCNRGVNGIEGSLSVAAGAAMADPARRVWCVIGDLSFFYDQNALWPGELSGNLRILLLNNSGGGIFYKLPGLEKSPARDRYIAAAHQTSARGICQQFGILYQEATDEATLTAGTQWLRETDADRPLLLEARTG